MSDRGRRKKKETKEDGTQARVIDNIARTNRLDKKQIMK